MLIVIIIIIYSIMVIGLYPNIQWSVTVRAWTINLLQ